LPVRTEMAMGTLVTIQVVSARTGSALAMERAFGWFHEVEARCTRFRPESELMRLGAQPRAAVPASPILFEAVRFALLAAEASGGAFDPTVGRRMQARGFLGQGADAVAIDPIADDVSWRDVELDPVCRTIRLRRPLTLDLGAVAKGLAVDLAARELAALRDFAIDAGGDLYLGGSNQQGAPWHVGIRHPREDCGLIASLRVSDQAVCTSGDYERLARGDGDGEHHILDPRTGTSPRCAASVTVMAPGAMLADALATAAFVMGPEAGIALLEECGVDGMLFTPELERHKTMRMQYVGPTPPLL
jgi:thiamine biosynthesis lipoprotein